MCIGENLGTVLEYLIKKCFNFLFAAELTGGAMNIVSNHLFYLDPSSAIGHAIKDTLDLWILLVIFCILRKNPQCYLYDTNINGSFFKSVYQASVIKSRTLWSCTFHSLNFFGANNYHEI